MHLVGNYLQDIEALITVFETFIVTSFTCFMCSLTVYSVNKFYTIDEVEVVRVVNKAHKTID